MARINIEETLYHDPRFDKLVIILKSKAMAVGSLALAWRLAQTFYKINKVGIPLPLFKELENADAILQVGLAIIENDFVYLKGSKDCFQWVIDLMEAGKMGSSITNSKRWGKKTLPLKSLGNSVDLCQPLSAIDQPFSPSYSSSSSKEKENICSFSNERVLSQNKTMPPFDLELLYKKYPRKLGKNNGLKRLSKQIKTQTQYDNLSLAIDNFNKYHAERKTNQEYIPYFSTFASQWEDWINLQPGTITQPKLLNMDDFK